MRTTIVRRSFVAMLIVGVACETPVPPTAPIANPPVVTVPAYVPPKFPEPTGPSRIFVFDHELVYPVSGYTLNSRFVLYDTGAFALQYAGVEYRGGYKESDGTIVFDWEGWSSAGPWGATGVLRGNTLTVEYNLVMSLSDFEDGVYVRG